jgi:hypothetical protein
VLNGEKMLGLTFRHRDLESRAAIAWRKKKDWKSVFVCGELWAIVMESKKLTVVCVRLI